MIGCLGTVCWTPSVYSLGCGAVMLGAIYMMYISSHGILGSAIITTTAGVKQGSPTSCFLFIVFVNSFIRILKSRCEPNGFLGWLHSLMLMDDTVILATSHERLIQKLSLLQECCQNTGMVINEKKPEFMAINGTEEEKDPIFLPLCGCNIKYCWKYTYLGALLHRTAKYDLP